MRSKFFIFSDSLLSSGLNFLFTFFILKFIGTAELVSFGLAMTYSLIALSLQRAIILIPFNLLKTKDVTNIVIIEYFSSSYFLLFITLIILFLCCFLFYDFAFFTLVASMYLFLFQHELFKYFLIEKGKVFLICISPIILSLSVGLLLLSDFFSLASMSYLYFLVFIIEMCLLSIFIFPILFFNSSTVSYFYWFSNLKLVFYRNLFSIAQLSMVHVPFIIISSLASPIIASIVFVSRAVFQPVQIVVKTFEAIDQKIISEFAFDYKIIFNLVIKYFLISSLLVLLCFTISYSILYKFYDENSFPTTYDLIIWGGIYILISISKVFEMFFIKYNCYSYIITAYFSGFAFFVLCSAFFIGNRVSSSSNFSSIVFVSWFFVFIILISKLKSLNKIVEGDC